MRLGVITRQQDEGSRSPSRKELQAEGTWEGGGAAAREEATRKAVAMETLQLQLARDHCFHGREKPSPHWGQHPYRMLPEGRLPSCPLCDGGRGCAGPRKQLRSQPRQSPASSPRPGGWAVFGEVPEGGQDSQSMLVQAEGPRQVTSGQEQE